VRKRNAIKPILGCFAAVLAMAGGGRAAADTLPTGADAWNQKASALDPNDYKFVQPVCTRCHTVEMFLHSRRWPEWLNVFGQMYSNGARATPTEWHHIYDFFKRTLTLLDVNQADEEELSAVLGVDEKTAVAIVRRRADRKLDSIVDLENIPGVDKAAVEGIAPRLIFTQSP
jgi:hypothetical protein